MLVLVAPTTSTLVGWADKPSGKNSDINNSLIIISLFKRIGTMFIETNQSENEDGP